MRSNTRDAAKALRPISNPRDNLAQGRGPTSPARFDDQETKGGADSTDLASRVLEVPQLQTGGPQCKGT